jgi:hypothetical protein
VSDATVGSGGLSVEDEIYVALESAWALLSEPDNLGPVASGIEEVLAKQAAYYFDFTLPGDDNVTAALGALDDDLDHLELLTGSPDLVGSLLSEIWEALCGSKAVFRRDRTELALKLNLVVGIIGGRVATLYGLDAAAVCALVVGIMRFAAKIGLAAFCKWAKERLALSS